MARTTKASNAIERLKRRTDNPHFTMVVAGNGLLRLALMNIDEPTTALCEPMQLDDFVAFVNAYGPQMPKRESKLDIAFSKQLLKKPAA